MAVEVGSAELTIIPTMKGGSRALEKQLAVTGGPAVSASGKAAGTSFLGGFKSVVGPATAILGTGLAVDFAKDTITAASDLGESLNALDVVFGDASSSLQDIGEGASRAFGLSNLEFNNMAVQFSGFAKQIAGDGGDVVDTVDDIAGRAADFASVMNLEVAEAAQLFQSGLAGESEPLRKFSIDLSAAAVDTYAYANGIANVGEKLTEAEKVQARFGLLMQSTEQTAGDFENTSDSLANSQRILAAEWENMQVELGQYLLPAMTNVTGWLLETGLPAVQGFIDDIGDPTTTIGGIAESLGNIWDDVSPFVAGALEAGGDWASAFLDGAEAIIGGAGDVYGAFQEGGIEGATAEAADLGGELSAWAASGDSLAHQFVGAIDATMESWVNGTIGEDWLSGTAILGDDLSGWAASGDTAAHQFIRAAEDVIGVYASDGFLGLFGIGAETPEEEAARKIAESAERTADGLTISEGIRRTVQQSRRLYDEATAVEVIEPISSPKYIGFGENNVDLNPDPKTVPVGPLSVNLPEIVVKPTIDAPPLGDTSQFRGTNFNAPQVNIYGPVDASSARDIVNKARQASRTNSWSGGRTSHHIQ